MFGDHFVHFDALLLMFSPICSLTFLRTISKEKYIREEVEVLFFFPLFFLLRFFFNEAEVLLTLLQNSFDISRDQISYDISNTVDMDSVRYSVSIYTLLNEKENEKEKEKNVRRPFFFFFWCTLSGTPHYETDYFLVDIKSIKKYSKFDTTTTYKENFVNFVYYDFIIFYYPKGDELDTEKLEDHLLPCN